MKINKTFSDNHYQATFSVESWHHGYRLDQFIQSYLGTISRELVKKKIKKGEVVISNRQLPFPHRASTKVQFKDIVNVSTFARDEDPELWKTGPIPLNEAPTTIHEDDKILVISKPAFMVTHPTGRRLFYCATVYYQNILKHPIYCVHRLDRETSGILILAKTAPVSTQLTNSFESRAVKKCYFLIAKKPDAKKCKESPLKFPFWAKERLSIALPIKWHNEKTNDVTMSRSNIFVESYSEHSTEGKSARTYFEFLMEKDGYLFLLAYPKTGRQHQIRVHAAHHGFPLLGDKLYNGDTSVFMRFKDQIPTEDDYELMQIPRHALHAYAIKFPYENNFKTFISSIPSDLKEWMQEKLLVSDKEIEDLEFTMRNNVTNYFDSVDGIHEEK